MAIRDALVGYKRLKKKHAKKMTAQIKKRAKAHIKNLKEKRQDVYNSKLKRVKALIELKLRKADYLMKKADRWMEKAEREESLDLITKYEKQAKRLRAEARKLRAQAHSMIVRLKKMRAHELREEAELLEAVGSDEGTELVEAAAELEQEAMGDATENEVEYEDIVLTADSPFTDIGMDSTIGRAATYLYNEGVIGGYKDGTFRSDQQVNRAEASKFLYLAKYGEVDDLKNNGKFRDVLEGQWYVKYVIGCAEKGIINGDPDGTFRPADSVNRAELMKIIAETFDLEGDYDGSYADVSEDDWYYKYLGAAKKYNMYPDLGDKFAGGDLLTRGEVAQAIYNVMSVM